MLRVTNKPCMLSVIMLNVVILNVVAPFETAHHKYLTFSEASSDPQKPCYDNPFFKSNGALSTNG